MKKTYDENYLNKLQSFLNKTKELSFKKINPCKDEVILDVGCGVGDDVIELAKSGASLYGIDNDIDFINRARKKIPQDLHVDFYCNQAYELPFDDRAVDKIRADRLFQHLTNYNKVLLEFSRILKPNGYIQIVDTDYFSFSFYMEDINLERKIIDLIAYKSIPNAWKVRSIPRLLESLNFKLQSKTVNTYVTDDRDFGNYIIRFNDIIKEAYNKGDITRQEYKKWHDHQGNFQLSFNVILYEAFKRL